MSRIFSHSPPPHFIFDFFCLILSLKLQSVHWFSHSRVLIPAPQKSVSHLYFLPISCLFFFFSLKHQSSNPHKVQMRVSERWRERWERNRVRVRERDWYLILCTLLPNMEVISSLLSLLLLIDIPTKAMDNYLLPSLLPVNSKTWCLVANYFYVELTF